MLPRTPEFEQLIELIRETDRFLICSHESPEGDCLGASIALFHALRQLGREVYLYNPDPIPVQYRWMTGAERFSRDLPQGTFGAIFVLDCGSLERIGPASAHIRERGPIVNLDHHRTNRGFGEINLIDARASSAGELVYRLLKRLPVGIDRPIAEAIYTALLTDTGSFHYSNTTADTFEVARELMASGLEPARVTTRLYETMPLARLKLLSQVLETLVVAPDEGWASLILTRAMREATGATLSDAEGFINFARSVEGVEVAMLFRELDDRIGVSLRGKGRIDVAAIASHFNGGGHRNAAAFMLEMTLEEARPRVIEQVRLALRREIGNLHQADAAGALP